jgi:hypothetical protein
MDDKDRAQEERRRGPVAAGTVWRHFKGGVYDVICTSVDEATLTQLVTYRSHQTGGIWTRPLADFVGEHPVHKVKRFAPVEPAARS